MTITAAEAPDRPDDGRAVLRIDLSAVRANWRHFAALGPAGAVVKADAYGLGAARIAPALMAEGCRDFFVAQAQEGAELRAALGPAPTITVFNGPSPASLALFSANDLRPTLNSMGQVALWRDSGGGACALHIDTGMNRLGLTTDEARRLAAAAHGLDVRLVMSHLACADTPDHAMNAAQLAQFRALAPLFPGAARSLANSAGALMGPDFQFDLTRPGIGLYGAQPAIQPDPALRPVATLLAPILMTRRVGAGAAVGYGAAYTAPRDMTLAVAALGYADGLLRAAFPGGFAMLAGRPAALVGRVSMDLVALDVTGMEDSATPGAQAEFLGARIDALAAAAGTIPYELLTRLGARFARTWAE